MLNATIARALDRFDLCAVWSVASLLPPGGDGGGGRDSGASFWNESRRGRNRSGDFAQLLKLKLDRTESRGCPDVMCR